MNLWLPMMTVLLGTIYAIWVTPGIDPYVAGFNNPNALYLLSAIAQALAAILALIFSVVLIVAQLSSTHSSRMVAGFFDRATIAYMALFVASIFLPLWSLTKPTVTAIRICLTLTSACLLLLIPYFLSFRERLSPELLLESLYKRAKTYIGARQEPAEIRTLDNTLMTSLIRKDYDTFRHGISLLADLTLEAFAAKDGFLGHCVLVRIGDIGVAAISDPLATKEATQTLQYVGLEALSRRWFGTLGESDDALIMATLQIRNIGMKAVKDRQGDALEATLNCLCEIATEACRCDVKHVVEQALAILRSLGMAACESGLEDKTVLAGLTASFIAKIASDESASSDPNNVATVRASAFVTIPESSAPVLVPPSQLSGRGDLAIASIDVLRDLAWELRTTGNAASVTEISRWLREVAETARNNGKSEIASYAERSIVE